MTDVLSVEDVTREYPGGVTALDRVDLRIAAGELLAIVGPSGSGKSTLLNIMGTLDRPSRGTVRIGGDDVTRLSDRKLSDLRGKRLGFVFQQFHLVDGMSAMENVATGLLYAGVRYRRRAPLAAAALERVGLGHRLGHLSHQLSGGEKQRVAIARALVNNPALILADEPTGALDTANGDAVLALLSDLNREGATIAVITHDREIAARLPRRVTIRDGRIVEDSGEGGVRLSPADVVRLGLLGPRTRKARAALSALGIAIGIATMIVVTGIPASSGRALDAALARLGTNLLRVQPVSSGDKPEPLPTEAVGMVARIGPVTQVSAVANVHSVVRRSDLIDVDDGSGLTVLAGRTDLLPAVGGRLVAGRFLTDATAHFPVVVLGSGAAGRLGYDRLVPGAPPPLVSIGNRWFSVAGILAPVPLAPDLDQSVLVGWDAARRLLGFDGHPTVLYVRSREAAVESVRAVLPATVNPRLPGLVRVSRPSDALAAKRAAAGAFGALVLGLAGVSLLVGGVGVANTMVISVLERRREIGLRRGLGANRGQIRLQFLAESVALSFLGGVAGTAIGIGAVVAYATWQSWPVAIPPWAAGGGLSGALLVGVVAGVYPAVRAARLTPVEALAAA